MKKRLLVLGLTLVCGIASFNSSAQSAPLIKTSTKHIIGKNVPTMHFDAPDMELIKAEDEINDRDGKLFRIGVGTTTNITPLNSGLWTTKSNGDRVWQLIIDYPGAEALSFYFEQFNLFGNSTFNVLDLNGKELHKALGSKDVLDHGQQNMALCFSDKVVLELVEPAGTQESEVILNEIYYGYRKTGNPNVLKINESDPCQVNVNCSPEGDNWADEENGVARILVVDGAAQGWCTGSLVNNLRQDCKPLFLTALHCGVTSTTANFNNWRFYFGYESPNCSNPSVAGTLDDNFIVGSVKLASSNDGGGDSGSDFLLVQLGSLASEASTITTLKSANFNAYWNGWDANNTVSSSGVSIHHPAGDIKKISTYTSNLVSTTWGGTPNTHWRVVWSGTTNGHGVTEGGSSGSPIFNYNGGNSRIIGTLTGGGSYCNSVVPGGQNQPDSYGKMSYHWTSNPGVDLNLYLDPDNTGVRILDGSADPCSAPTAPIADFVGTPTVVNVGNNVQFTDLTSGIPDTWSWTITPGTAGVDWSYVTGTSASQNPEVQFNTPGFYTISLTASNAIDSDVETKTNYIEVVIPTDPCDDATSTQTCASADEYIENVTLETINNTTGCSNYSDYTAQSATLTIGNSYDVIVTPRIDDYGSGAFYGGDEMAVWIDFNNDLDFDDAGERVGYYLEPSGAIIGPQTFNFTVPGGAVAGSVHMRVRVSYQPDDGDIAPCGTTTWGEVEDYTVILESAFASTLSLTCPGNSTINASSGTTTVPNLTGSASTSTDCPSGMSSVTQSPAAGTALVEGTNLITITATDNCGSTETCTTTITYVDDIVLNLTCGGSQTVLASTDGNQMPDVTVGALASSNCPTGSVTLSQSPAAGTTLTEGANTVIVTATDGCGNTETCTVTVTYTNDVVLNLTCGGDLTVVASIDGTTLPNVVADATAISNCPTGSVSVSQSPVAGSTMTPGANTVTVTATDGCGNIETCTVIVTYSNDVVLNLTCGGDLTVVASSDGTTLPNVVADATATSNCPTGSVSVSQSPVAGSTMTPGANTVTVTATDGCGNIETCTVIVTYQDDLGIEDASVLTNVMIYPNPTEGNLFVDLTNIPNMVAVELYDMTGKLISTTTNHSNPVVKVDMNNLAKGMYQIRLTSNSMSSTHRVSKM